MGYGGIFVRNKSLSILNAGIFLAIILSVAAEVVFNLLGLWTAWNLYGFFIGLLMLPLFNIVSLISAAAAVASFVGLRKTAASDRKLFMVLPFLFFSAGFLISFFAYTVAFEWGGIFRFFQI